MNRQVGWLISLGLFAALGAVGLYTPLFQSSVRQIETDVRIDATTALRAGQHDQWASIDVDGQTIRLSGEAPDRAARNRAIADLRAATGASGPLFGGIARVETAQTTLMPQPLLQDPFRFRTDYQGGFVKFDLHIPHEGFGNRLRALGDAAFPNANRTFDETVLARGMPDNGWPEAIITALTALGKLDSGYLYAEETLIKLNGTSATLAEEDMRLALSALPTGYRVRADMSLSALPVKLDITGTATPPPLNWSAGKWQAADDETSERPGGGNAALPQPPGQNAGDQNLLRSGQATPLIIRPGGNPQDTATAPAQPSRTGQARAPQTTPNPGTPVTPPTEELNVPSPAQLRSETRNKTPGQRPASLPARPEPVEAFKTEPMMVETTPLEINAPTKRPDVRRTQTSARTVSPTPTTAPAKAPAKAAPAPPRNQSAGRMPTTYVPPRPRETEAEQSARVCQNEVAMMMKFQGIAFFPASRELTPGTRALLAGLTDTLSRCTQHRIDIIGHTDNIGSAMENLQLSRERARVVAEVFSMNGIPRRVMTSTGLGERLPIADNATERGRMRNRRVEILISPRADSQVTDKKGR
ncbi:MAG: OmpA family protein [Pseudomonadota bacterium]